MPSARAAFTWSIANEREKVSDVSSTDVRLLLLEQLRDARLRGSRRSMP
jgi:hypothetical protein